MAEELTYQEAAFLLLDRMDRTVEQLRDELRTADEFLQMAQERVNEIMQKQGPGLPHVILDNQTPQSIGFQAGWQDEQFIVRVFHRGTEDAVQLPPSTQAEIKV